MPTAASGEGKRATPMPGTSSPTKFPNSFVFGHGAIGLAVTVQLSVPKSHSCVHSTMRAGRTDMWWAGGDRRSVVDGARAGPFHARRARRRAQRQVVVAADIEPIRLREGALPVGLLGTFRLVPALGDLAGRRRIRRHVQ